MLRPGESYVKTYLTKRKQRNNKMKLNSFLNVCEIANDPAEHADSIILVYTDTCQVIGPFFSESDQYAAYDKAVSTGRPFTFDTWAHKG